MSLRLADLHATDEVHMFPSQRTTSVSRTRRLAAFAVLTVIAVTTTAGAASARLHDPKFDYADLALEKAQVLLLAASCPSADDKATKECEKARDKAITDILSARQDVADAAAAADGGAQTATK
jgi:hypothetical protein